MSFLAIADLVQQLDSVGTAEELTPLLTELCLAMGFQYFALTHHVDTAHKHPSTIQLHNYPAEWVEYYLTHNLGVHDPVHRASHVTNGGFLWSQMKELITLTPRDEKILAGGRKHGIGDGLTIPAHVPGEALGSCTFVNSIDRKIDPTMLLFAQAAGAQAFSKARALHMTRRDPTLKGRPKLTDRQRDIILWAARGKSDYEIGIILALSQETVARHFQNAFARYGLNKRLPLAMRTVADGTITVSDAINY